MRRLCTGLLLISVAFLPGCGPTTPRCVPVSGTVTLDGAKVPGPGYLYFTITSTEKDVITRPGTAEFDAEGNYKATTFVPGDGLMPGKYLLRVDCWKTPPNMDGKPVVSFLPTKYQNAATSEVELTVAADARAITFDIKLSSK